LLLLWLTILGALGLLLLLLLTILGTLLLLRLLLLQLRLFSALLLLGLLSTLRCWRGALVLPAMRSIGLTLLIVLLALPVVLGGDG